MWMEEIASVDPFLRRVDGLCDKIELPEDSFNIYEKEIEERDRKQTDENTHDTEDMSKFTEDV